jgi:hypothetical protein
VAKYQDAVEHELVTFAPFVVSTLGSITSIAPQALAALLLLQKIASRAFDYGYTADSFCLFFPCVYSLYFVLHPPLQHSRSEPGHLISSLIDPIACFMPVAAI